MFFPMYFDPTYFLVLIGVVLSLLASGKVKSTFARYSQMRNSRGLTGAQAAEQVLHTAGIYDVRIEQVRGNLTDHYDPRTNTIRLSESVYDSTSVAAIGVAAHEAGHAAQHDKGYLPIKLRNMLVPVANFSARLAMPLILFGFLLELGGLVNIAIILYSAVVLFSLITLPVEYNASRRALVTLDEYGILTDEENSAAKKVLGAAAMTYVASMLAALGSFLRILAIFGGRRDR